MRTYTHTHAHQCGPVASSDWDGGKIEALYKAMKQARIQAGKQQRQARLKHANKNAFTQAHWQTR